LTGAAALPVTLINTARAIHSYLGSWRVKYDPRFPSPSLVAPRHGYQRIPPATTVTASATIRNKNNQ